VFLAWVNVKISSEMVKQKKETEKEFILCLKTKKQTFIIFQKIKINKLTLIMKKRKGLSVEEKKKVILGIYHERMEPFNLKEIETLASRAVSIFAG
jgi:glucose-6-phosphate isomerase